MKINIVAVGKIKESFYTDGINEYLKRMSRYAEVNVTEVDEAKGKTAAEQVKLESERLLAKSKGYIVAFDKGGKQLSSEGLASLLKQTADSGQSTITFLIGGSFGLSDDIKTAANAVVSFGSITLPHQLFRLVLCEQTYRAISINENLPYHK